MVKKASGLVRNQAARSGRAKSRELKEREEQVEIPGTHTGFYGEFDPGSGRTLAACLTHASRARKSPSGGEYSGGRVSNT